MLTLAVTLGALVLVFANEIRKCRKAEAAMVARREAIDRERR